MSLDLLGVLLVFSKLMANNRSSLLKYFSLLLYAEQFIDLETEHDGFCNRETL